MTFVSQVDYRGMLGPIRDQGSHPTCVAHAVSSVHEFVRSDLSPLSAEYLYYFASEGGKYSGTTFEQAEQALKAAGQPLEADCGNTSITEFSLWKPPSAATVYRRLSEILDPKPDRLADELGDGRVPVIGLTLPIPFFTPADPWIISTDGSEIGRHAVVVVGLSSNSGVRMFQIRNSWGLGWGDKGHAWVDDHFLVAHLEKLLVLGFEP